MFAFVRRTKSAPKPIRAKAPFLRPRVERLEDRLAPALIQAISVADPTLGGGLGNSDSLNGAFAISPNGRYVAFESYSSNLVPGDTNGVPDVFVRDNLLGATTRVSTDSAGNQSNAGAGQPALTVDASGTVYVAFASTASNLVSGDTNGVLDVFVKNLTAGLTTRVNTDSAGNQSNGGGSRPVLAVDGSGTVYVAFWSGASDLVGGDTNLAYDVFLKNLSTGATSRASTDSAGNQSGGDSFNPALAVDGSGTVYVAFSSSASNLVGGDTNNVGDVFVKNVNTGLTTRASTDSAGNQVYLSASQDPAIAVDGNGTVYVAFWNDVSQLVSGDNNNHADVFLKNLTTGATSLVSTDSAWNQADLGAFDGQALAVDDSGTVYAAFWSAATNLVSGDTNGVPDVFVKNLSTGVTSRVGPAGGSNPYYPSIAVNGTGSIFVAFWTGDGDLVPGDVNVAYDVFLWSSSSAPLPLPIVSIADAPRVTEGDDGMGVAQFEVTLSAPAAQTATVHYTTVDGTATGGKDFEPTLGTLTFAPNQTSAFISVKVFVERLDESDESFLVELSSPSANATIGDGTALATIKDDDTSLFVITHGFMFVRNLDWVFDMATAMNLRLPDAQRDSEPEIQASLVPNNYLSGVFGKANPESHFILFDWSNVSTIGGIADSPLVAGHLADVVNERIQIETDHVDIHFVGFSRGCYVNMEAIRQLKRKNADAKIDFLQMTTLDPQSVWGPFGTDGKLEPNPGGIVDFAENYFQQTRGPLEPAGKPILGALNVNLTKILAEWKGRTTGVEGILWPEHDEVHDWYHWTIDTDDSPRAPVYADTNLFNQQETFFREQANPVTRDLLFSNLDNPQSWIDLDGDGVPESFKRGETTGFYWSITGEGLDSRPLVVSDIKFGFSDATEKALTKVEIFFNRGDIDWDSARDSAGVQLLYENGEEIPLKPVDFHFDSSRRVLTINLTNYEPAANKKYELRLHTNHFSVKGKPAVRLVDDDRSLNGILCFELDPKKRTFDWC